MARPKTPKKLNYYGLDWLGYANSIEVTGDWNRDQLAIEMVCFRIGLKRSERGLGKFGHFKRIVELLWNNPDLNSTKKFIWCEEAETVIREFCVEDEVGGAGPTSLGKTEPLALWAVVNYLCDPTHTKVILMSTTIKGAKDRVWGRAQAYLRSLPDYPGKPLWSSNLIKGPDPSSDPSKPAEFWEESGMFLYAGEQGKASESLEKLIGIKAARTGKPVTDIGEMKGLPEFAGLAELMSNEDLEDLLPRLCNLSENRTGRIIFGIDEATGVATAILDAYRNNMQPGNDGYIQLIMLGNPNLHMDTFGLFCEPENGWDNVSVKDDRWRTKTGGLCLRFNAENNSRIKGNRKVTWMLTQKAIDEMAINNGGRESLYYYRFVLGMWCPQGMSIGVYSQADVTLSGAMGKAVWGFQKPVLHSSLDPNFTIGGDKASCTFFHYGQDTAGRKVMEIKEQIAIKVDAGNNEVPIPYQIAREWKRECIQRGVIPFNACYDATGGGVPFGAIVSQEWSPKVQAITWAGKASKTPIGNERNPDKSRVTANQRFSNKMTEIWYGAHPFLRRGQIKGITTALATELCSRMNADRPESTLSNAVTVETKKVYKRREGHSPDDSDSFLNGVEHLKTRHGFKPLGDIPTAGAAPATKTKDSPWEVFKQRARRITTKTNLPR